ncbi:hypothetical protein ACWT_1096 [Actinoplanes sp. SE50]|uniref:hypothetical protein n=1 Tax=unclassified Actinoplanes TaxID=2626549 RepID=UPI00023ECDF8|nr:MULTISPECIES: hypothetical protein [unclassified Actinoplanes]AEV82112.1 hypothetical protein ACPL_1215 [Actinoplanes sp. SE50/110]ATO80511.1 hypothetical protein ACWT_1096 [Actinoplanes sp. SE50]SLL97917.1 hypothetical protein ACSP50_1133 [Actinoplanes sp. SE50/110]
MGNGFIEAALSFPTVLLTPLLILVIGYWIVVIVGGAGPDAGHDHGGLLGVPLPVSVSLLVALAWFGTLAGSQWPGPVPPGVIPPVALVAAALVTRLIAIPLRRLLPDGPDASRADFVGRTCVIRTGRVTGTFGQAEVHAEDGSSAIIQVRQTGVDALPAGTVALIYDVDPEGEFFWVVPADIARKGL